MLRPLSLTGLVGLWLTVAQLPGASPWGPLEPGRDLERVARARASDSRLYRLDLGSLRAQLKEAPRAGTPLRGALILLPAPDGSLVRFAVEETAILHPDLQARFPHLRTYTARGVDDATATAQLDDTDFGIRAQVISRVGRWYLDPLPEAGADVYQVVARRHGLRARGNDWKCHVSALSERAMFLDLRARALPLPQAASVGASLRTFRVAIAATGEYTRAAGGTVSAALSQITTALNRVAGIYQSELSISFQLVANNHLIVYSNPASDPYSGDLSDLLDQNQTNLDSVIGSSNYDFGHVFTTSGGGLAQLEAVCDPLTKAQAGTGLADPFSDIFYQDYVAHEFGHQFGARHSFNSDAGQCNPNRDGSSAYEPGSGSTIMAYPGLCLDSNIQEHSDPYFHAASLLQVGNFLTTVFCGTSTPTGNRPPVLALRSYVVPYMAPFELPASGYDPDGDPLLWTFDQFDLGRSASHLGQDTSSGPQFRSRPPAVIPVRSFPEVRTLTTSQPNPGEVILINTFAPAEGPPLRALNFRVAARDGRGGVTIGSSQVLMHPRRDENAPAFRVTNPSGFGLTFPGGTAFTLRWNVGNSRTDGIDTATVSIRLSADNGLSFPYLLAAEVPNNGEAVVMLPQLDTSGVRFKISAVGNIFYALSSAFTVTASAPTPAPLPTPQPTPTPTVGPTPTPLPTPTATPTRTPTPTVPGVTVFPTATPTPASRLINVSTRLRVETGESVAIAGFVLQGTLPRRVLVRALGPSLAAFGVVSPLADPALELVTDGTTVATNDSWQATQRSVIQATGFAPANDAEAVIVATLPPGAHTAILRGTGGTTGVGIIEVYELDGPGGGARLINLSTRGQVLTGQNVMIGGFVIEGVSPVAKRRVLIRALGPSLAAFGIAGVLPDPVLTLKDAAGVTVAENDDWDYPDGQNAVLAGLAPLRARESTIVTTLSPGAYTATVSGFEGVTGVSLIEVYELP